MDRKPDGAFWNCPHCTGSALNLAVLRRCLRPDQVKTFWRRLQTAAQASAPCPSCARPLREFTLQVETQTLTLDLCKTCQIVWFDKGEFEALPERIVMAEVYTPEVDAKLAQLKAQVDRDFKNQLKSEANRVDEWAHIAVGIVHLLLRIALRV
jgi:Zn-finger nucleic acid-binding protein